MSHPSPRPAAPVVNPTTTQKPVISRDPVADAAAQQKKEELKDITQTNNVTSLSKPKQEATSSSTSILTSGAGILEDEKLKKNSLGGGLMTKNMNLG